MLIPRLIVLSLILSTPFAQAQQILWAGWGDGDVSLLKRLYQQTAPAYDPLYFIVDMKLDEPQREQLKADAQWPLKAYWQSDQKTLETTFKFTEENNLLPTQFAQGAASYTQRRQLSQQTIIRGVTRLETAQTQPPAMWRVQLRYADNKPVPCGDKPCEYRIITILPAITAVWTNDIDVDTPVIPFRLAAPRGDLYLWMHIKGDSNLLNKMEQKDHLPIRHKWSRFIGSRPYFERTEDVSPLIDEDIPTFINDMRSDVKNIGYFDLKIWSKLPDVQPGWWQVEVVYANNSPVLCGQTPCTYRIAVQ